MYMEYVKSLLLYGCSIFYVTFKKEYAYLPTSFYMAINLCGVHVVTNEKVVTTIQLMDVVHYKYSAETFNLKLTIKPQNKKKRKTYNLLTYEGEDIAASLRAFSIKFKQQRKAQQKAAKVAAAAAAAAAQETTKNEGNGADEEEEKKPKAENGNEHTQ